ncbi:lmd-5 [Pristionchus pacificus]|uniref:Lmd-5 n=1 Tax=Pristionchus pacificus TaxID=54126 RepID=A0A2A6BTX8_PRIPA|nr:lmd-5 [Pristionchus pacificus]|eukprot:PDM69355.1 lmd-5 [Pristionchus pacificus]
MNRFLLLVCGILAAVAAAAAGKLCGEWKKVESRNTCYSIRTASGLSEELFAQLNPSVKCDALQVGQKLCISETDKLFCYEHVTVSSGESCWSIRTAHQLDEREFMEMNEGLNCDLLSIGQKLCARAGVEQPMLISTVTPVESEPVFECPETVAVVSGDTCHGLMERYGLNTTEFDALNDDVDCDSLHVGSSVCASREGCQLRYETQQGDSCHRIAVAFKISVEELKEENDVDCDRLQVGRRLCVWRSSSAEVSNLTCSAVSRVKEGDTCWSLSIAHGISVDDIRMLNPRIDCDLLQIDAEICVRADAIQPCTLFRAVDDKDSCEQIATVEEIPYDFFVSLNPTLNCDRMNLSDQVCIGRGPYEASKCVSSIRATDPAETCASLLPKLRISQQQLLSYNPKMNCSSAIPQFSMVCSSATQTEDRLTVMERLFKALGVTSPVLLDAFNQYKSRPSQSNNGRVYSALVSRILEELATASNDVRLFMDSGLRSKSDVCGQLRGSDVSTATLNCFCESSRLNVYCHALLYRELDDDTDEQGDERSSRDKRSLCSASPSVPSLNIDDYFTDKNAKLGQCFGADCSVQMGFVEITLAADVCMPFIMVNDGKLKFCLSSSECSQGDLSSGAFVSRLIADGTSSASLSLCLLGSQFIRRAAKIASKDAKVKSTGVCLTVAKAEYSPLAGKLDLSAELNLLVFDVKGGGVLKAHDLPVSEICDIEDLECNDYCLWKFYNTENWKAYGYIEVRLFKIFDFFEGIKIAEEKFNAPRKAGCNPNKEVAILWADERTCEDDSVVVARCMSGSDKAEFKPVGREYNGLTFRSSVWGNTLFFIEFVDANNEKLGFDVYGGKSKNRASKGNFYYAVRNDGIYYGTNPKEVSIEQLRKLTHAIFAFIATSSDGSVDFGVVSEDDSSPDAAALARQRFFDLKTKARRASAGVRVLFAVGGWDNSQHFSSIASDEGKRRRFIDSCADFLKLKARGHACFIDGYLQNTGVDGVDVDWEYPVTGGAHEGVPADKENYVRLLRELRERLDRLQRDIGRKERYIISLASAAGEWTIRPGYDLKGILEYADFINVMTYDYYGAWGSKWGAYTGPPAPLYYGQP